MIAFTARRTRLLGVACRRVALTILALLLLSSLLSLPAHAGNAAGTVAAVDAHPAIVRAGQKTKISGRGFMPSEVVQISFDNIPQRTVVTTRYGAFGGQVLTLSLNNVPGIYALSAVGLSSHRTATSSITVLEPLPGVDAHPAIVRASQKTKISGRGFMPGEVVQISFDNIPQRTVVTTRYGAFGGQVLTLSLNNVPGTHALSAVGLSSHRTATSSITVLEPLPGVDAHPAIVRASQKTKISGRGFMPGEVVQISFDGIPQRTVVTTRYGAFGGQVLTLSLNAAPGIHTLTAVGLSSHLTATSSITVIQ